MIFLISRPAASRPSSSEAENRLCLRDAAGNAVRDLSGNPVLECMCGNVLCGRFNPALPFFTAKGSFWTNGTSELLAGTSEANHQARTRNRCNGEGYESVALIALRHGDETKAQLQVNDRAKGRFTLETDRLSGARRRSDRHGPGTTPEPGGPAGQRGAFSLLVQNMRNGFAYCRMLFDDKAPHDFVYLAVNDAFGSLTGLKDVVGKKASEVIPGLQQSDPGLLEIYGRVALTGAPESFETYVQALGMWFAISVYSPSLEHFVAVFDVITERKRRKRRC